LPTGNVRGFKQLHNHQIPEMMLLFSVYVKGAQRSRTWTHMKNPSGKYIGDKIAGHIRGRNSETEKGTERS
jgi:hypothetical protein